MKGVYVVNMTAVSISTAITILQVKAGADAALELLRVSCWQSSLTTSAMQRIQLLRKTAAATVTSFTPLLTSPNDAAAKAVGGTSATGTNASAEGTDGDIMVNEVFNILSGWLYLPVPEERIQVIPAGIIALKFPAAPAAMNVTAQIIFREIP
jgi:hypothetical protein